MLLFNDPTLRHKLLELLVISVTDTKLNKHLLGQRDLSLDLYTGQVTSPRLSVLNNNISHSHYSTELL